MWRRNMKFDRPATILFGILIIAFFLRIYRVDELTEFLGDQGRESMVLYNAWHTKTIPLVGPPVSTGQHLGPIYYYLIAPSFVLAGFNPLGPIVFMVLLDVATIMLLYQLISRLFNKNVATAISALYTVSPLIMQASRTIWNPTPIPFFTTVLLISLYKSIINKKFVWLSISFASLGVLVQLHYSTIILLSFTGISLAYTYAKSRKNRSDLIKHSIFGLLILVVLLTPFLGYQSQNEWTDVRSLLSFASSQSDTPLKTDVTDSLYVIQHLVNFLVPAVPPLIALIILSMLAIVSLIQKNKWSILALFVILVSIAFISRTVYSPPEHYTRFLIPFLFILTASSLETLNHISLDKMRHMHIFVKKSYLSAIIAVIVITLIYLPKSDILSEGKHDLSRTEDMAETMIQSAEQDPFSFTLINSRSFSDLHYRFFFLKKRVQPVSIESEEFDTLYLVCEKEPCPTQDEIVSRTEIQVMCFDPLCNREYPKVNLKEWQFESEIKHEWATLYVLKRK
ncbi:MAG: hypothetical protein UU41_C0002G0007 [Candidatus Roizmanbacteria bacterium GW2011_GWA1_41_13]|uniref:Glycosyltransferase RgtA/B/C/D-like domain-containing protein n=1 Tax=Candidatus Roizmanbacteria bacterium GW2011_GWA1_41_13 TaxID=1618474 RepID=A0A0G0V583_9BACT|nr:MAG: hypothetical protein UU41_C0002G0007 [Candidatus Roizmanbacteria bacterium GW2011_GWA1_41_13]